MAVKAVGFEEVFGVGGLIVQAQARLRRPIDVKITPIQGGNPFRGPLSEVILCGIYARFEFGDMAVCRNGNTWCRSAVTMFSIDTTMLQLQYLPSGNIVGETPQSTRFVLYLNGDRLDFDRVVSEANGALTLKTVH